MTDIRVTQSPVLALAEVRPDLRITQSPVLALAEVRPDLRITQSPVLALVGVEVDIRITQTPVLALVDIVACVTKWAQTWTITRKDGQVFAFTSLDRDLVYRGITHKACNSLAATATEMAASLGSTGSMELIGIISDDDMREDELLGGLFDGAFVEVWMVPWENAGGEIPFRLLAGTLGDTTTGGTSFNMEIITPGATMQQRPLLEVYEPGCRFDLGDERCGFDLPSLEVTGVVTSIPDLILPNSVKKRRFNDVGRFEEDTFFALGEVTWLTGDNAGTTNEIKDFSNGSFTLWNHTLKKIQVGDTYEAVPGCDKSEQTCKDKFDIFINFGGFPDVPGQDEMLQTPDAK